MLAVFQQLAEQASAQGITWVNSSGDAGAAACDPNGYPIAQNGPAVLFPASIPEARYALRNNGRPCWSSSARFPIYPIHSFLR